MKSLLALTSSEPVIIRKELTKLTISLTVRWPFGYRNMYFRRERIYTRQVSYKEATWWFYKGVHIVHAELAKELNRLDKTVDVGYERHENTPKLRETC